MSNQPKSTFARRVRSAKPRDRKYGLRDDVVIGLGLAVQPSGVRTFVLNRHARHWKLRTLQTNAYNVFDLKCSRTNKWDVEQSVSLRR